MQEVGTMNPGAVCGGLVKRLLGRHAAIKSFEHEL
jgi:hypothetical protein